MGLTIVAFNGYQRRNHGRMSDRFADNKSPLAALKSDAARQRWELFHRAIAHAKQSTHSGMEEPDEAAGEPKRSGPLLSIVR